MQVPIQVTFKDMQVSDAVERECWEEAAKLERYYDRITSCNVVISEPHRRHQQGNLFDIRIHLLMPGGEVVVNREPPQHHKSEDAYVAIREAFDTARRQLEDFVGKRRARATPEPSPPHGRISELYPEDGYGFIQTPDGREIYFHRNSVVPEGFERCEIGSQVRFVEEEGEKGPQATTVHLLGRHHHFAT